MTIWFSTNIPEMRAISVFNRASNDIAEIQQRIGTGQRILSGRDDPGGLVVREGLRADIKGIHGLQLQMNQAEILTNIASTGMMDLLGMLVGEDMRNPSEASLIGVLNNLGDDFDAINDVAKAFIGMYDAAVARVRYGGDNLLSGFTRDFRLGGADNNLTITIGNLADGGAAAALKTALRVTIQNAGHVDDVVAAVDDLQDVITKELGKLGGSQGIVAMNQRLLDSQLTSLVAAEGRISNADLAVESSRLARAELLAQNAMQSILYNRSFAAFSVRSLFG